MLQSAPGRSRRNFRGWLRAGLTGLTLLYAWLCYYGNGRWLAVAMACLWLLRAGSATARVSRAGAVIAAVFFAAVAVFADRHSGALYWYPLLVNIGLFLVFAGSLYSGQPVIERIARLQHPDLPPEGVRYTRRVTCIWCGFFIINAAITALLTLPADKTAWTIYTGIIAYLLTGLLLAGEWLYRRYKLKL